MEHHHHKPGLRVRLRITAARRRAWLSAGLQPACRKPARRDPSDSVHKVARREIGGGHRRPPRPAAPSSSAFSCPEKFRNFQLQEEYDTYDDEVHFLVQLPCLWSRTKIIEIVAAKDVIFALAQSGLCGAFNRGKSHSSMLTGFAFVRFMFLTKLLLMLAATNKRICYLNISPDEVIRSLFYNKNNESLITVSVYESDRFSSLKCRTTPIEYIRRGQLNDGFPLFETESLKYPGFVEFDDVNGKVLTFSAQDSTYKVFDLKNYNFLYSICDKNIQEIKISPGIMLVIYQKSANHVPLKILSIEDGTPLKTFTQLLHRSRNVDFIEQFNEKLLVKQDKENLQIIDVRNSNLIEVNKTEFMTPSAFIFLYENNLFLTFCNRTVAAWNFRGELVTSFDDHELWHSNCNTNNIYITADQDLIISYCKASKEVRDSGGCEGIAPPTGSINMSNIFTGKCVAKISPLDPTLTIAPRKRGDSSRSTIRSTVSDALEDITALFYDEDRNEIYTGNSKGLVHVWSN
uniref:Transducin/WD40 repeat-like superfamily protein n=1 Tax=Oryza glumipatula TaxID=40148 RepID=A0A0D9YZ98_9ORYZ